MHLARFALVLILLVAPLVSDAQQASTMSRIGYLDSGSRTSGMATLQAFRQGLRDLGWVEGQNIAFEVRFATGKHDHLPELAAELVRLKVDVIYASTTPAALAAKHATMTVPIVFGSVADPVGSGVVPSLARPGGNITGWTHLGLELRGKYLELLKETLPGVTRMGALWNPANPVHVSSVSVLEAAARALNVQLHLVGAQNETEIESAFSALAKKHVEALAVLPDGLFRAQRDRLIALAARNRLPTLYGATELPEVGGLMGYGVNFPEMFRRGAYFVDRILKGAKPAELPIEQPTRFYLVINLKTARALGLSIPPSVMLRADRIIE